MAYAEYKHYFEITDDYQVRFENELMYSHALNQCKGKRPYILIRMETKNVTHKKYKFYFGIIIGKYCMESNIFSGYNKKQIHNVLFEDLRGREIKIKGNKRFVIDKAFEDYNDTDMDKYINEVIPHLAIEYNVYIKDKNQDYEYKS